MLVMLVETAPSYWGNVSTMPDPEREGGGLLDYKAFVEQVRALAWPDKLPHGMDPPWREPGFHPTLSTPSISQSPGTYALPCSMLQLVHMRTSTATVAQVPSMLS